MRPELFGPLTVVGNRFLCVCDFCSFVFSQKTFLHISCQANFAYFSVWEQIYGAKVKG